MKTLLTLLTISIMTVSNAQFVSEDDMLHATIGAGISATSYTLIYAKTKNSKKAFWYSLGLSALAGLSKEIYDGYIIKARFDTGEAIATAAGGFVASYTLNIFTGKQKRKKRKIKKKIEEEEIVLVSY
ncbi:hypothetical protein [Winogradskyella schleiferi]|uniref:hypothetical protein n=1 Tax=Winogradskyella schleiferi TaxID=2686078 RepID=UPI0015BDBD73|nr:hypothetical protein [Winogradskyella schleiferi]